MRRTVNIICIVFLLLGTMMSPVSATMENNVANNINVSGTNLVKKLLVETVSSVSGMLGFHISGFILNSLISPIIQKTSDALFGELFKGVPVRV